MKEFLETQHISSELSSDRFQNIALGPLNNRKVSEKDIGVVLMFTTEFVLCDQNSLAREGMKGDWNANLNRSNL